MNKFLVTIVYFLVYHITKKNRVDLFERILATDAEYAYKYAKYYLQKRFILAEPVIQNSDRSDMYLRLEVYWRIKDYTLIPQDYNSVVNTLEFKAEEKTNLGYDYINTPKYHIYTYKDDYSVLTNPNKTHRIMLNGNYYCGDIIFVHERIPIDNPYIENYCVFKVVDISIRYRKNEPLILHLSKIY